MPRGVTVSKEDYDMIKRALKKGLKPKQINELTGFSEHTISRVKTTENYEEFCEIKVRRTKTANEKKKKKTAQRENEGQKQERKEEINTEQDIHDMAREMLNIRNILQKLAEDLGVKL